MRGELSATQHAAIDGRARSGADRRAVARELAVEHDGVAHRRTLARFGILGAHGMTGFQPRVLDVSLRARNRHHPVTGVRAHLLRQPPPSLGAGIPRVSVAVVLPERIIDRVQRKRASR